MVRLHLLGFTPDLKGLVFSGRRGGRSGTYWVSVDDTLASALDQLEQARVDASAASRSRRRREPEPDEHEDFRPRPARGRARAEPEEPPPPPPPRIESKLSPAEIQQLLRQGRSVKDIASKAGVDAEWIERFVGPVLHEISGIVAMTREAVQDRPRLGRSAVPIGDAVVRNLVERRATAETLESIEDGWEARRVGPGSWRVRLRFVHRGRRRVAEWEFRTDTRAVRPRNKEANALGWVAGGRSAAAAPSGGARRSGGSRSGTRKASPKAATARKRSASKATPAKRGASKATPAKRGASKRAGTKATATRASAPRRKRAKPPGGRRSSR